MRPQITFSWDDGADQSLGLPSYETAGAVGADLKANLSSSGSVKIKPGARALISTGLRLAIPIGFEVQIRPRSGLSLKYGITVANAPGTIDSDYRGPLGIILLNVGQDSFTVMHGDRIAQMVVAPAVQADFSAVKILNETVRGQGGFGSTGIN
jgi:dUTP pyrophosphatase